MSNKQRRQKKLQARTEKAKRARRERAMEESDQIPDRRVMEKAMWGVFGHLQEGGSAPSTPLHRAQALCYEAVEQDDPDIQVQMAQHALAISPDCADAYVLLAENAHSRREELEMYEQGIAAGERALGPEPFQNDVGHFWGILETRPYMRARLGLAHALWTAGRREEGVQHLQDMLRLNPNDNQGVRYTLAEFLLSLDRDEELGQLFEQYSEEGSALWSYTRALLAFRRQGDTAESRRLLKMAKGANRHVLEYLLGRKLVPRPAARLLHTGKGERGHRLCGAIFAGLEVNAGSRGLGRRPEAKRPTAANIPFSPLPFSSGESAE